jgi:hypothetical protein
MLPLAGCASIDPQTGSPDPRFSEASRWNAAAQIIDPDPVWAENSEQPGASGAKAAGAAERYRTDRVKEPRVQTTTTTTTGGAGAGQGSGPK